MHRAARGVNALARFFSDAWLSSAPGVQSFRGAKKNPVALRIG
jgi:hypothetical protein